MGKQYCPVKVQNGRVSIFARWGCRFDVPSRTNNIVRHVAVVNLGMKQNLSTEKRQSIPRWHLVPRIFWRAKVSWPVPLDHILCMTTLSRHHGNPHFGQGALLGLRTLPLSQLPTISVLLSFSCKRLLDLQIRLLLELIQRVN